MLPNELAASSAIGVYRTAAAFSSNSGGGGRCRHSCFQQTATSARWIEINRRWAWCLGLMSGVAQEAQLRGITTNGNPLTAGDCGRIGPDGVPQPVRPDPFQAAFQRPNRGIGGQAAVLSTCASRRCRDRNDCYRVRQHVVPGLSPDRRAPLLSEIEGQRERADSLGRRGSAAAAPEERNAANRPRGKQGRDLGNETAHHGARRAELPPQGRESTAAADPQALALESGPASAHRCVAGAFDPRRLVESLLDVRQGRSGGRRCGVHKYDPAADRCFGRPS